MCFSSFMRDMKVLMAHYPDLGGCSQINQYLLRPQLSPEPCKTD
jgi:hypothetical protein